MQFVKYHALGNDYVVLDPDDVPAPPTAGQVQAVCDRHCGIGSDGVLYGPLPSSTGAFAVRIFNPDGGEAEKSGNGLRIFSRYLWDRRRVPGRTSFAIDTAGGPVTAAVAPDGAMVTVEMGTVRFASDRIPVEGPVREVINEILPIDGEDLRYCAATIGNPHCVILSHPVNREETLRLGPLIETDARFPRRTNVQFMEVIDRHRIRLEIWERGAGYTLASGSSACASAAVAVRLGLCDTPITVQMPGGDLQVKVSAGMAITITGPVTRIAHGTICDEIFRSAGPADPEKPTDP